MRATRKVPVEPSGSVGLLDRTPSCAKGFEVGWAAGVMLILVFLVSVSASGAGEPDCGGAGDDELPASAGVLSAGFGGVGLPSLARRRARIYVDSGQSPVYRTITHSDGLEDARDDLPAPSFLYQGHQAPRASGWDPWRTCLAERSKERNPQVPNAGQGSRRQTNKNNAEGETKT